MPFVNVDLDDSSPFVLLRIWFNILRLYPGANMEVYVSPSGVGWHVKTDYEVDAFNYIVSQALLWADPVRTQYALRKLYLNPGEQHLDLMFDEKEGKSETAVPFTQILSKYAPEVTQITINIKEGKYELADQNIKDLAKKISPELDRYHKSSYVGCIGISKQDADAKDKLETILLDIAHKDISFKYRWYPSFYPDYEWILALYGSDKDQLWKRLTWLKNKTLLKDLNTPLWVKQRITT